MTGSKVTIRDLAQHCGCSVATISRVINNTDRVSPSLRLRVEKAIGELGYIPDSNAKTLRTKSSRIVGILISELEHTMSAHLVAYLQNILFSKGYTPVVCNMENHAEREKYYIDMLQSINACAMIVLTKHIVTDRLFHLDIPVIFMYRNPLNKKVDNKMVSLIQTDNYRAGCIAGDELIRLGCRRISEVRTRSVDDRVPLGRHLGLLNTLFQHNANYDETLEIVSDSYVFSDALSAINCKLDQGLVADGYFCVSDILALALVLSLTEHGYHVGENVKVIGCNDMPCALYNSRPITSIRHDIDAMCMAVMDVMERMLRGESLPPEKQIQTIPVSLVRRATT